MMQPYSGLSSPGPIRLPPGMLEPVEEIQGDSDLDDSEHSETISEIGLSNIEEEEEDEQEFENEEGSIREKDPVFEKIKETLSKTLDRTESRFSDLSSVSNISDGPQVQISQHYTSLPYGIQPKATYEHSSLQADIMGVAYSGRMRQFVILDSKGITTWKRDIVDPRVRRALQYPKYEYRLIMHIVYAPKYNCYFALGKDFSVKVLNRDFEETCSVNTDMRSVLYILFNPVRDELITGGVGGIKIWQFLQVAGKAFTELKPLANYELRLKDTLPNVGGSWVKKVELDYNLQHLYCCSDTDLHVYDLTGKLLFKFERAHTMSITGCCFSMSAKVLVTSSVDSEVKVWSLTGGLVHTFRGHSRAVTSLLLHPDTSSVVITSSLDGSIRMWSLDTMDLLYMIVVSADGVLWMGLTDDKMLYVSTCRNITLWHLNKFYSFWSLARSQVTNLCLAGCEDKSTRVVAVGDDSSVRIVCRGNHKNISTVLPPPDISPLQKVLSVCYSREKNAAFLLVNTREIWVYTTRTDPASRISKWTVYDLQLPYITGDSSLFPPGGGIQPPSTFLLTHRATENGSGNEIASNCCSVCILNSPAMMWTQQGPCCPIRQTFLLLGMEDGRILFMDPVIKGQKYMELKASKDAIQEMRHDDAHKCLITLCRLKTLVLIQNWGLPQLDLMHEFYCAPDVTSYGRVGLSMMTGHESGHVNIHPLEPAEDLGVTKAKQEPPFDSVVDSKRRPEHQKSVVALDALAALQIYVTCSVDGAIKVWDENKVLLTEIMLDESLSSAAFLNDMGDLLVGFKNHIFYIDHTKLCPAFKPPEIEMETSDQESAVYEDPRVLYELLMEEDEQVTLENYLVPYDHLAFDNDFLEGKTKIEQPKTAAEVMESSESETETDISLAPSSIYMSPADSIESLSMIDLTLGADYSKYDLRDQMKATLDQIGIRAKEDNKWNGMHPAKLYLKLRKIQLANAKTSKYVHRRKRTDGKKRRPNVNIESLGQSDLEDKEIELELEKFSLPLFGESPGGSPSITPPSGQASPRRGREYEEEYEEYSDDDRRQKKPSGFVPILPPDQQAIGPEQTEKGSVSTHTHTSELYTYHSPEQIPTVSSNEPTISLAVPHFIIHENTITSEIITDVSALGTVTEDSVSKKADKISAEKGEYSAFQKLSSSQEKSKRYMYRRRSSQSLKIPKLSKQVLQKVHVGASHQKQKPSCNSKGLPEEMSKQKSQTSKETSQTDKEKSRKAEEKIQAVTRASAVNATTKDDSDHKKGDISEKKSSDTTNINENSSTITNKPANNKKAPLFRRHTSSEFDRVMQLLSESDADYDSHEAFPNKAEKQVIDLAKETLTEETEPAVNDSKHESDVNKSANDTEALSNVDLCLTTSVGTEILKHDSDVPLSPTKTPQNIDFPLISESQREIILANQANTDQTEMVSTSNLSNQMHSQNLQKENKIDPGSTDLEGSQQRSSSGTATEGSVLEKQLAAYSEEEIEGAAQRLKGAKVDIRGLLKKRRITSGRTPSLTRRSSMDHAHDEHDHEHEHGHDDKRSKKEIKKKQKMEERKIPLRDRQVDMSMLASLPPNPPSMLSRKRSLGEQQKNFELTLLHRPEIHKPTDPNDYNLTQVKYDTNGQQDADQMQEEQWAKEAAVHGTTLTLPPQKDKNRARQIDKPDKLDPRLQRKKQLFGDGDSIETHIPGVGSSPTAELEDSARLESSKGEINRNQSVDDSGKIIEITDHSSGKIDDENSDEVTDLDSNAPETQMQRTKRLGYKLDSDKVFENEKTEKNENTPGISVTRRNRPKLNVYIPQAERESISSAKSSRRGTPDSGIGDATVSNQGVQTPRSPDGKLLGDTDDDQVIHIELSAHGDTLSEEEKASAIKRPASSFTGLRRGQLEGEKLKAERPHTAHVRFRAEDLQTAFEEALRKYQNLPGAPAFVSADKLYKNDGVNFEDNWQERAIERHTLLRMQKEIRAQSAAQRRQAYDTIQKDRHTQMRFNSRCDSAIGGFSQTDASSIQMVKRANTSMSVPISMGYGVGTAPPPTRDKPRPKTANPNMQQQQILKNELSQEKAFRYRLSKQQPSTSRSRPASSKSISTVADFSPHWIDPRNPDAWRPKSSRSIPSKCNRYVLVNKPREKPAMAAPSPLEEQLLVERFPKLGSKIVPNMAELMTPRVKKSYTMEYSPFVYQRFA